MTMSALHGRCPNVVANVVCGLKYTICTPALLDTHLFMSEKQEVFEVIMEHRRNCLQCWSRRVSWILEKRRRATRTYRCINLKEVLWYKLVRSANSS